MSQFPSLSGRFHVHDRGLFISRTLFRHAQHRGAYLITEGDIIGRNTAEIIDSAVRYADVHQTDNHITCRLDAAPTLGQKGHPQVKLWLGFADNQIDAMLILNEREPQPSEVGPICIGTIPDTCVIENTPYTFDNASRVIADALKDGRTLGLMHHHFMKRFQKAVT